MTEVSSHRDEAGSSLAVVVLEPRWEVELGRANPLSLVTRAKTLGSLVVVGSLVVGVWPPASRPSTQCKFRCMRQC